MASQQSQDAIMLERELREMADKEKGQAKRQTMLQAARLLRDLIGADDDEPYNPEPTDDF